MGDWKRCDVANEKLFRAAEFGGPSNTFSGCEDFVIVGGHFVGSRVVFDNE